ncbi:hypothetical protein STEG23_021743 [Scotinomys teguina]
MYQRFLRQHVAPQDTGGDDRYCNVMMQRRKMTTSQCKRFNTFIHEDIWNIRGICSTANIQCKNGNMNCHEGVVKVTDCRETGSSRAPNCRYRASASTRRVVIACEGNPAVPVHFDRHFHAKANWKETPPVQLNNLVSPIETPPVQLNNLVSPIETPPVQLNNLVSPIEAHSVILAYLQIALWICTLTSWIHCRSHILARFPLEYGPSYSRTPPESLSGNKFQGQISSFHQ